MKMLISVIRPDTLVEGRSYLLQIHHDVALESSWVPVIFCQCDPCPAMVIVGDREGRRWRCSREDIYLAISDKGDM